MKFLPSFCYIKKIASLFVILLFCSVTYSQINSQTVECLDIPQRELAQQAFQSFENDLITYYEAEKCTPNLYRSFLKEVASLSLDLRKFPSDNSIEMARSFKQKIKDSNSLWLPLSVYENQSVDIQSNAINATTDQEVLTFNYKGDFIQCLKNHSNNDIFKQCIIDLQIDANISPSIIASRLKNITSDEEFYTEEIKAYIAFDIYYSILLIIESAF